VIKDREMARRVADIWRSQSLQRWRRMMANEIALSVRHRLTGILPPLSMPFDEDGALVPGALAPQIDFMVKSGATAPISSGGAVGAARWAATTAGRPRRKTARQRGRIRHPFRGPTER
jgi:4-hydroxy-tetrahydrodipicolinate synthase